MRSLSFFLSLFAVVALLLLGAGGTSAASAQSMPCHEMDMTLDGPLTLDRDTPAGPAKPPLAMACCIACVAPPLAVQPPVAVGVAPRPSPTQPALFDLPAGRSPSPEPGPPRT